MDVIENKEELHRLYSYLGLYTKPQKQTYKFSDTIYECSVIKQRTISQVWETCQNGFAMHRILSFFSPKEKKLAQIVCECIRGSVSNKVLNTALKCLDGEEETPNEFLRSKLGPVPINTLYNMTRFYASKEESFNRFYFSECMETFYHIYVKQTLYDSYDMATVAAEKVRLFYPTFEPKEFADLTPVEIDEKLEKP